MDHSTGRLRKIKKGDTLYKISREYNTTVAELVRLNPDLDAFNLKIGDRICLPREFPLCPSKIYWEVDPGDTLYSIARTNSTTVDRLLQLNPNVDPKNLQPGMRICLP